MTAASNPIQVVQRKRPAKPAEPQPVHKLTPLERTIYDALVLNQPGCMHGWTSPERGVEMANLILQTKPKVIVEIGVFGGRATLAQALALKENGFGRIYGIDPWKNKPCLEGECRANADWWAKLDFHDIHRQAMESFWKHDLDKFIVIIRAASEDVVQLFKTGIDVLYIDGNHSEVASCRDVQLYAPILNQSAYVWMDDCDWPTTKRAQELLGKWCDLVRMSSDNHYGLWRLKD